MKTEFKIGEIFIMERPSRRSATGYGWGLAKLENLVVLNDAFIPTERDAEGVSGRQIWTFQGLHAGNAAVQFVQYRIFDNQRVLYEEVLPFTIIADDKPANAITPTGGWKPFAVPSAQDAALFKGAFTNLIGVDYEPVLVSSQGGVQIKPYFFLATAKALTNPAGTYPVIVRICENEPGKGTVEEIRRLGSAGTGAPKPFEAFKKESPEGTVLAEAFKGRVGLDFTALAVSVQTVAGKVCLYAGNGKHAALQAVEQPIFVKVYAPLPGAGGPHIVEINDIFEY